ncbi:MAG: DNA polymerase III subunit delta [Bacteroidales bacterium]|nr:DNA polymerase III subunit delta [Bacteroidales bacterium]
MAKEQITYFEILTQLRAKKYLPVYYLMGEESYYIDELAAFFEEHILTEEEKEFNLTIVYGGDTDMATIVTAAKRYPMMAEYQIIIVKEAQSIKDIDNLEYYLQNPAPSTLLVFCHKHGVLDRRRKVATLIRKQGVLYESKAIRERELPGFIVDYVKQRGTQIDSKASAMLADYVGTDLSRMAGELDKLLIARSEKDTIITPDLVERNIGISKQYNNFELQNAIIEGNVFKANQIIKYFDENSKNNPVQVTLTVLFNYFSNLMLAYYAPSKTEQGIVDMLSLRFAWQAKDYIRGMQRFSGVKTMQIIDEIRYADAKTKGVDNVTVTNGEVLKELIFKIMH